MSPLRDNISKTLMILDTKLDKPINVIKEPIKSLWKKLNNIKITFNKIKNKLKVQHCCQLATGC